MKIIALMIITAVVFFLLLTAIALGVALGIIMGYESLKKKDAEKG